MFEVKVKRGIIKAQAASETLTFIRLERHGKIIVQRPGLERKLGRLYEPAQGIDLSHLL